MSELVLVKSSNFGNVKCDFWQNDTSDILMTREQIGLALEYSDPRIAIYKIHERHKDRLDKYSVVTNLTTFLPPVFFFIVLLLYSILYHMSRLLVQFF